MQSIHINGIERAERHYIQVSLLTQPNKPKYLKQSHKVTRENVSSRHTPVLINQFTTPPPIFWRSSDSDDIVSLKIEFFRDRRFVVIKRAHFIIIVNTYISLTSKQNRSTVEEHGPSVLRILICNRLRLRLRKRHQLLRWRLWIRLTLRRIIIPTF